MLDSFLDNQSDLISAVGSVLSALGEDLGRSGLCGTPNRVARFISQFAVVDSKAENTSLKRLVKLFDEPSLDGSDQVVSVECIPFFSLCEHHLLPFFGTVSISYVPSEGRILGLSKFSRIVDHFSKKLQTQERFTESLASFLFENIPSLWLKVEVEAEHMCMLARGVKALGSKTRTRVCKGSLNERLACE